MNGQAEASLRATVVILTRDAGEEFSELLDLVSNALPDESMEVLVVDSGSRDATVEIARMRGARLHEIPAAEFNHGRTRNLAAELARGEFVAFLSQDALPLDNRWLRELLEPFKDERVVGSYSRIVPRVDASPLVARSVAADLTGREAAIDQRIEDPAHFKALSARRRRIASHFNNVASCVRRAIALQHPFPERSFGEDLAWAYEMISRGRVIAYRPRSVVIHSHESGLRRDFARHRSDAELHLDLFEARVGGWQAIRTFVAEVVRDVRELSRMTVSQQVVFGTYSPLLRGAQALGRFVGAGSTLLPPVERGTSLLGRRHRAPLGPRLEALRELFDEDFYLAQVQVRGDAVRGDAERGNAKRGDAKTDPLAHYLNEGDAAGHWPHPLFDPTYYSEQRPKIPRKDGARLLHYFEAGDFEKLNPHRLFDALWYTSQPGCNIESGRTSLVDYLVRGDAEGRWPHPLFDPAHYHALHPEIDRDRGARLIYFASTRAIDLDSPHPLIDAEWMLSANPELASVESDILSFYAFGGEDAGVLPNPFFDPIWYREHNPDLATWQLLLYHYTHFGTEERRRPCDLFDAPWYTERYSDARQSGLHPIVHYRLEGDALGHWPSPDFDPRRYGTHVPDVAASNGERLIHFERNAQTPSMCVESDVDNAVLPSELRRGSHQNEAPGSLVSYCRRFFARDAESPVFENVAEPDASIIVAAHGAPTYTLACLRALATAQNEARFEVILVLDGPVESDDSEDDPFVGLGNVTVLRHDVAQGFVRACNEAAQYVRSPRLVFLNNDTIVCDRWLDALVRTQVDFPNAGIIASQLLQADGRVQESGGVVFRDASAAHHGHGEDPNAPEYSFAREADYASAAAIMIEKELFASLGGFDERFAPAFYEDTDLAFRVREAGKDVVCQPASSVVHFGGMSYRRDEATGRHPVQDNHQKVFLDRWGAQLALHEADSRKVKQGACRLERGRVLVLDATTPTPLRDSGSLRMFNLLRLLRRMHYRVTFVASDLGRPVREVARLRAAGVEVVTPPYVTSIDAYLEQEGANFDLCVVSRPRPAERFLESVRSHCTNATIVYDTVDLHYLRRSRQIELLGESEMSPEDVEFERTACRASDRVLVVSEHDRTQLLGELPGVKAHVISNIHESVAPTHGFGNRSGILFIGGFRHTPNVDAMIWFASEVLPRIVAEQPDAVLHIVGGDMPHEIHALASPGIVIEGWVDDPTPLFESCLVSVAPLRYGSGVKGKVNQSMSHGLPCVATTIAAEGTHALHGRDLLIADDAEAFAECVLQLHRDAAQWQKLSRASIQNIEQHFSMTVAERAIQELLEASGLVR